MKSPTKRSLLVTATALVLFGCTSPIGSTTFEQAAARVGQDQTPAAVEQAVFEQFAMYQRGDMRAAFSTLAKECQRAIGRSNFTKRAEFDVLVAELLTDSKVSDLQLRDVRVIEFTAVRATYSSLVYLADGTLVSDPRGEVRVMVYEGGQWKFGECPQTG